MAEEVNDIKNIFENDPHFLGSFKEWYKNYVPLFLLKLQNFTSGKLSENKERLLYYIKNNFDTLLRNCSINIIQ